MRILVPVVAKTAPEFIHLPTAIFIKEVFKTAK